MSLSETENPGLRRQVKHSEAMLKDVHLLEAALAADCVVVSLDDTALRLFRQAAQEIRNLRKITWANPVTDPQAVEDWLKQGAKPVKEWRLGSSSD